MVRILRRQLLPCWPLIAGLALAWTGAAHGAIRQPNDQDELRQLIETPDLSSLALSPDGRFIAFRTEQADIAANRYRLRWHIFDLDRGRAAVIADGGDANFIDPGLLPSEPPIWSPDSRWIYFRALERGEVQIRRAAIDGSTAEMVTGEASDVEAIRLSADGRSLAYAVGPPRSEIARAEQAEYDEGILVDAHVELAQNLFRGAIINGRHASQRLTGTWFSRGGLLWRRSLRWRQFDLASGRAGPANVAIDEPARKPDPRIARSAGGDVARVSDSGIEIERRGGLLRRCEAAACRDERISWLGWRPGRDQLVFATADLSHAQRLWQWDLQSGKVRRIAAGNGQLAGSRNGSDPCALSGELALCVAAGPGVPPRLVSIDLDSGILRTLFDPNPRRRARNSTVIERLSWRSADGRRFTGILFRPRKPRARLALFINYYRCEGFIRGGLGDEWPFAAYAASGIASICINATRMEGPQDGVGQYRAALGGIEALIHSLDRRGLIDPGRVGMGGLSFGSEVTMWTAMHSRLLAALSLASPQFEPANYWFNGVRGRDHHQTLQKVWGLGAPEETPNQWKLLSPALNVDRINVPVLMQLAEQEARYAPEFHARLSNSPTPVELYVFPDEPHIKIQPRHRWAVYRRNLDWFRFWLKNEEDSDPARKDQYLRWRELKARFQSAQRSRERSQSSSEQRSNIRK